MDQFLTTTVQEYGLKIQPRRPPNGIHMEFEDPLMESYKKYLHLSSKPNIPKLPEEKFNDYLSEFSKKHEKVAKMYFEKPLNDAIMSRTFIDNGKSIYQIDYCDLEKDEAYKEMVRQKNLFRLPNDYDVPLTTQKYCYRHPMSINSRAYEKTKIYRNPNSLDKNEKLREILKVTTGLTEYGGVLGGVARIVMKEKLHLPKKCVPK